MSARPLQAMSLGYRVVSPVERAGFGMTSAFALQGAVAALAAIALAIRFHYRGTAFVAEPAVKTALIEVPGGIA